MSEPMQEAAPGFVVARAWSCGCTAFNRTSSAPLFFSGALLFMLFNISTSFCFADTQYKKGNRIAIER
jgi:hypothetical protein